MKTTLQTLNISALALGLLGAVAVTSAQAVRFPDGRIAFDRPPTLVEATTQDRQAGSSGRYHFVIEVPADAGEPLGSVVITPRDHASRIAFSVDASEATLAPAYAQGPSVELASVGGPTDGSNEVLVAFADPVQPGETVTVTLSTNVNPWGGVYLFGVTGYPAGENSMGQFLGYGRLHIYDNDN